MSLPTLLVLLLASALPALATAECPLRCGDVEIPYPFGIGKGCFREGFEITCQNTNGVETPVLPDTSLAFNVSSTASAVVKEMLGTGTGNASVLSLSVAPRAEVRVMLNVAFQCFDINGNVTTSFDGGMDVNANSVYRISNTENELFILGCNTFMYAGSAGSFYEGCLAYCNNSNSAQDGACEGIGCCHVNIPPGLTDTRMTLSPWGHKGREYNPCNYAFITEKGNYSFQKAHLASMPTTQTMPLRLDWAIRGSESCDVATTRQGYACVSGNTNCTNSANGPGYVCHCEDGYQGNPYIQNGCQDIDECSLPKKVCPGNNICHNTDGEYTCHCHGGFESKDGNPKNDACTQIPSKFPRSAKLTLGIVLGVSFVVIALLLAFISFQKRQLDKVFEKNGGKILENVKGLTIFTKEGLKKITNNNSDFLGNGSFGKVYKGILPDETIVAVKASIAVNEDTKKEFIDEVEIQTNMIHKNILRLVGCCLEVDVPMLVYEFAANGSLQDILHQNKNQELPLDLRLDIAIGSAEGLKYMHSYTTQAIRHGDVKPDNILLDDKLTPKISDFGLSKLVTEGHFAKTVVGCMGYIDPVFLKTGLLTQKSDVYSFGAVLLELITGKKNVYDENLSLIIEFCKVYEKENSGRALFDKEIANEEDMFVLEEISKLAVECLNEDIDARPDMMEVAERLVMLRRDKKLRKALTSEGHLEGITMAVSPVQQRA